MTADKVVVILSLFILSLFILSYITTIMGTDTNTDAGMPVFDITVPTDKTSNISRELMDIIRSSESGDSKALNMLFEYIRRKYKISFYHAYYCYKNLHRCHDAKVICDLGDLFFYGTFSIRAYKHFGVDCYHISFERGYMNAGVTLLKYYTAYEINTSMVANIITIMYQHYEDKISLHVRQNNPIYVSSAEYALSLLKRHTTPTKCYDDAGRILNIVRILVEYFNESTDVYIVTYMKMCVDGFDEYINRSKDIEIKDHLRLSNTLSYSSASASIPDTPIFQTYKSPDTQYDDEMDYCYNKL